MTKTKAYRKKEVVKMIKNKLQRDLLLERQKSARRMRCKAELLKRV